MVLLGTANIFCIREVGSILHMQFCEYLQEILLLTFVTLIKS